jgi:hypothetical protein
LGNVAPQSARAAVLNAAESRLHRGTGLEVR